MSDFHEAFDAGYSAGRESMVDALAAAREEGRRAGVIEGRLIGLNEAAEMALGSGRWQMEKLIRARIAELEKE